MPYQDTPFGRNTGLPTGISKTPPQGARMNDLSGPVPANQVWAQAYNQAARQQGGSSRAQSWTMPGSYQSQSYNPAMGAYSQPSFGQSWDGNLAYSAMDNRPGPITATATGVGGTPMDWQGAMRQRDAFVGNLVNRLNQYSGGQMTGPPTFDPGTLLKQANQQIEDNTWNNPFAPPPTPARPAVSYPSTLGRLNASPEVQAALNNASPFANSSQWRNPFGNSEAANVAQNYWPSYQPTTSQRPTITEPKLVTPPPPPTPDIQADRPAAPIDYDRRVNDYNQDISRPGSPVFGQRRAFPWRVGGVPRRALNYERD